MKNEETIKNLSEEVKTKLAACKNKEEVKKVLAEAGVEPLSDEDLDKVAGGQIFSDHLNKSSLRISSKVYR